MSYNEAKFWHPMLHPNEMKQRKSIRIVRGDGCYVFDEQGRKLVDGVAGLWNVNVGHNRQEVKDAIVRQLDEPNTSSCSTAFRIRARRSCRRR